MAHLILKNTMSPIVMAFFKEIKGRENIPLDKPFILACNHISYYDTLSVPSVIVKKINKKVHFYINDRYYRGLFLKWFLTDVAEGIPVDVSKTKNAKKINEAALRKAMYFLKKKKEPMAIFPEGSRSQDGKLKKAKTGIAYLLLKAKVPVLPCGIEGSEKILPKGAFIPRLKRCKLKIGKLMYFDKYYKKKTNKTLLNKITREIMVEIAKLSNQKYKY